MAERSRPVVVEGGWRDLHPLQGWIQGAGTHQGSRHLDAAAAEGPERKQSQPGDPEGAGTSAIALRDSDQGVWDLWEGLEFDSRAAPERGGPGIGSYPPDPNGEQRKMRSAVRMHALGKAWRR